MDFKQWTSKFNWKNSRDKWLLLLAVGLAFFIFAVPTNNSPNLSGNKKEAAGMVDESQATEVLAKAERSYEQQMEERVKEILQGVEGVGRVEVMIVLKSSEEKVWRVDSGTTSSLTQETDSSGGTRKIENQENSETTILKGGSGAGEPIMEKELKPQVSGVIISATGGDSPKVKAEISQAMEALFDLPSHKIKVLKRVE